ncbi:integrase core domain-containing protein [Photorhabdus sp. S14-60]
MTQLGKLTQNKFIESFNSHFRDKCLNSMILKDL